MKAYRQDFDAVAALLADDLDASPILALNTIGIEAMRSAFAEYARTHSAASIRRCWSTWNVLCTYLFTAGLIDANPMPLIGAPKARKSLPRARWPGWSSSSASTRSGRGPQTGLSAIIVVALLVGLRAAELLHADVGDIRRTLGGAVIAVRGKGKKDRGIPVEEVLVDVVETYLDSRRARFPGAGRRRSSPAGGLAAWPSDAPLFVGGDGDGDRISRGTLQYRVLRAFRLAGIDHERAKGALLHGFRHTFATELANADVSVYELMNLLGHESMTTSQRYVSPAAVDTRDSGSALYRVVRQSGGPG